MTKVTWPVPKLALDQQEAAAQLGMLPTVLAELIDAGESRIVRFRSAVRVPYMELVDWLARNTRAKHECLSIGGPNGRSPASQPRGSSPSLTKANVAGSRPMDTSPSGKPKPWRRKSSA